MNLVKKFGLVLILSIFIITGAVSCGSVKTVTPTDYDSVKTELAAAKTQNDSLQTQIESLQKQIEELGKQVNDKSGAADNITKQYDALNTQYQDLIAKNTSNLATIADLQTKYQQLKSEHDLIAQKAAEVNEANIEKALLDALNVERTNNGLKALTKGTNIVGFAQTNSQNMARDKQYLHYDFLLAPYQEVFFATGYSSVDSIVAAILTTWKSDTVKYQMNVLNVNAIYGTVDAYLADGIYYITFIASNYP